MESKRLKNHSEHRGNVHEALQEIGQISVYKYSRCKMNRQIENSAVNRTKTSLQDLIH